MHTRETFGTYVQIEAKGVGLAYRKEASMKIATLSRRVLATLVVAVALLGAASGPLGDDDNGSRVCLGSMGMVACVPPA